MCYCPSHSAFIPTPLSKPHSYLSFCICSWDISVWWESNISECLCFIKFVKQQNIWSVGQHLLICYHGSVPMCLGEAVFQHILGFILVNGVNPLVNRGLANYCVKPFCVCPIPVPPSTPSSAVGLTYHTN